MLDSFPVSLLVGCLLGFLAGLGVGGGSILMLWLTLVLSTKYETARIINLLFFIPTAVIASLFRWKQGKLELKMIFPAIIAGCIFSACFTLISQQMDISAIKKLFGVLLLATGIRELLYKPKKLKDK